MLDFENQSTGSEIESEHRTVNRVNKIVQHVTLGYVSDFENIESEHRNRNKIRTQDCQKRIKKKQVQHNTTSCRDQNTGLAKKCKKKCCRRSRQIFQSEDESQ